MIAGIEFAAQMAGEWVNRWPSIGRGFALTTPAGAFARNAIQANDRRLGYVVRAISAENDCSIRNKLNAF
jgi:hypothetical protein